MGKTLLDKLKEAKQGNEVEYVCFFNNGEVREEEKKFSYRIQGADSPESYDLIEEKLCDATESYSRYCSFDTITLNLALGLIYHKEDVDSDHHIRENAQPLIDVVRFYTGNVLTHQDGEQTNKIDYYGGSMGRQGYVRYSKIVSRMRDNGIEFNGPETFRDFKEAILSGEPFDIGITANLVEDVKKPYLKTR